MPLNVWSFVVGTYDGQVMRLYVNGVQVASKAVTHTIPTGSGALLIGREEGSPEPGTDRNFDGLIDEPAIDNRALTLAEIQALAAASGTGNRIQGNRIFSNGALGIDLGANGVTTNDAGDADVGPNNFQNFPVLSSAVRLGAQTRVQGTLNSTPNTTFTLEFFASAQADPSGYGEGQRCLGSYEVTTNPSGDASFDVTLAAATASGEVTAATATGSDGTSEFSAAVIPTNQVPTAEAGGPYTAAEGGSVPLDGSASSDLDQVASTLSYAWDLDGDNVFGETGAAAARGDETGVSPSFSAAGLDGYAGSSVTVSLRVTDSAGARSTDTATISITNVAPAVGAITAPLDPRAVNTPVSVSATFTDPGTPDTHTATWDWGDGTTSAGIVTETNGSGTVTGSHTYASAGVYTVTLMVNDDDTGSGQSVFRYVVVYDSSAGFATGGGWINSPAGAYAADPSLTGRANFGFVSRYQPGNTVPDGNTEFHLQVANFRFKSTAYEWLVVSGAKARFRGTGTVNGSGSYGFELTAWDGQVNGGGGTDRFRIKIWDSNQGNGVVYDNQMNAPDGADPTTALGGGSIVIHTGDPLRAVALPAPSVTQVNPLSRDRLQPVVDEAIARWQATGLALDAPDQLRGIPVRIADLGGDLLGLAVDSTIWLDDDAAGWGWFVDPTPFDDSEFTTPGDQGEEGRIDVLNKKAAKG